MNQIIMILLISILVLVHEAGHFIAARLCGVRVSRFGIGMPIGPERKLFRWKNTDFYIHAFLFGGYVAFPDDLDNFKKENDKKNEDGREKTDKIDENDFLPSDSPELYENKTLPQKLFIVSAGVIMNVVFALLLVMLCAFVFKKLPASSQILCTKGFIQQSETKTINFSDLETLRQKEILSNAEQMGIKENDRILKVNGKDIETLYQIRFFAQKSKLFDDYADEGLIEKNISELKRLNPELELNETIKEGVNVFLPEIYAEPKLDVNRKTLRGLERYQPSGIKLEEEQIKLRDEIFGKKTYKITTPTTLKDMAYALSDTYKPANITVCRDGKEIDIEDIIVVAKSGQFGIMLCVSDVYMQTTTFKTIVINSLKYCYNTTKIMLEGLWQLIIGKIDAGQMHGVIAVVKIGGDIIASKGILNGLLLTAMISINLAIMNFLPIPALDGGHVMFLIIEQITGKKPSKEFSDKLTNFFFILLIILMIAICYNDIFALVTKKF